MSDDKGKSGGGLSGLVESALGIKGGDEDALTLLKRDHREVDALFERFDKLGDGTKQEDRRRIVEEICALLSVHAAIEEEVFYPRVRSSVAETRDLLDEAQVEHGTVKELVARLQQLSPNADLYKANVTVLKEYVKHHVKEEEHEIFPKVKSSKLDLDRLGKELEARKLELMTAVAEKPRT